MRKSTVLMLALALTAMIPARGESQEPRPDTVTVRNGVLSLRGLLWRPSGRGPFPAVLFNHGSGAASDPRRPATLGPVFASHGYAFLYLFRRGAGLSADQGTNSGELMRRALAEKGQDGRNELQMQLLESEMTDVLAGHAYLRERSDIDARRIAVAGHSFGGQLALLLIESDTSVRAAVVFGAAAASWETSAQLRARLLTAVARTHVPVFFIHAANDISVAPGKALAAEMTRLGKPNQVRIFPSVGRTPGEGHDFVHLGLRTWERDVFAFLDQRVRR